MMSREKLVVDKGWQGKSEQPVHGATGEAEAFNDLWLQGKDQVGFLGEIHDTLARMERLYEGSAKWVKIALGVQVALAVLHIAVGG